MKVEHQSKVIIIPGEQPKEFWLFLDYNSNMTTLFFEFIAQVAPIIDDELKNTWHVSAVLGEFGERRFFRVSIYNQPQVFLDKLAAYIQNNLLMYAN